MSLREIVEASWSFKDDNLRFFARIEDPEMMNPCRSMVFDWRGGASNLGGALLCPWEGMSFFSDDSITREDPLNRIMNKRMIPWTAQGKGIKCGSFS